MVNVVLIVVVLTTVMAKTMTMIVMIRIIQPQSNAELKILAFILVEIQATDQSLSARENSLLLYAYTRILALPMGSQTLY
jgi:thiaminase